MPLADTAGPNLAILPDNTVINEKTRMYTLYVRAALRPISGLQLSGEGGYRNAPDTGYIRELDDLVIGSVDEIPFAEEGVTTV